MLDIEINQLDTKKEIYDLKTNDELLEHRKGLKNYRINNCNDSRLEGDIVDKSIFSAEGLKKEIEKFK